MVYNSRSEICTLHTSQLKLASFVDSATVATAEDKFRLILSCHLSMYICREINHLSFELFL